MSGIFELRRGDGPLLVSIPHAGTELPPGLAGDLAGTAEALPDTDWHVPALYPDPEARSASRLAARFSRYLIDLNRPCDGQALYPGRSETGLCPESRFDGGPVYRPGRAPGTHEVSRRVGRYWAPYHAALAAELEDKRERHGYALLWDAHSIRSEVPRFFEGRLPDFNFGTDGSRTCPDEVPEALAAMARDAGFTAVVNGRFRGGFITRRYGEPESGVYSLQLELSQRTYMDEDPPYQLDLDGTRKLAALIGGMMDHWLAWAAARDHR